MIFNNYVSGRKRLYEGKSRFYYSYYGSAQNISSTNLPQGLTWNSAKSRYESIHSESVVSKISLADATFEKYIPESMTVTLVLNNSVNTFSCDLGSIMTGKTIIRTPYQYFLTTKTVGDETVTTYATSYNLMSIDNIVIKNPMLDWTVAAPAYEDGTILAIKEIIYTFDFADGVTYDLSNFLNNMKAGSGSKNTVTYVFYLDHSALKSELSAKADQYTTITCYHLNGTEWA